MTRRGATPSDTTGTRIGSPALRAAVWARDDGICGLCSEPVDPLEWNLDHIIPVFLGGPTIEDNLRVTHPRCNRGRPRRMTDEDIVEAAEEWTANEMARLLASETYRLLEGMEE